MDDFSKRFENVVQGSLACIQAMRHLRETIVVWDSDSYMCMDELCKAYAHFCDEVTILMKSDELPEMPKE